MTVLMCMQLSRAGWVASGSGDRSSVPRGGRCARGTTSRWSARRTACRARRSRAPAEVAAAAAAAASAARSASVQVGKFRWQRWQCATQCAAARYLHFVHVVHAVVERAQHVAVGGELHVERRQTLRPAHRRRHLHATRTTLNGVNATSTHDKHTRTRTRTHPSGRDGCGGSSCTQNGSAILLWFMKLSLFDWCDSR